MIDITGQVQAGMAESGQSIEEAPKEEMKEEVVEEQTQDQSEPEDNKEEQTEEQSKDPKSSWKELQQQAEEGKRAKEQLHEAYRLLAMMQKDKTSEASREKTPTQKRKDIKEILASLNDDEYSSNKELKKILLDQYEAQQEREERILKEIESQKKETKRTAVEQRIYKKFPDFDDVCSDENISALNKKYPSLLRSIAHNPDAFEQAETSYNAIRDLGLYKEPAMRKQEAQLKNNLSKPKSAAAVGSHQKQSALSNVSRYNYPTEEELGAARQDLAMKTGQSLAYNE